MLRNYFLSLIYETSNKISTIYLGWVLAKIFQQEIGVKSIFAARRGLEQTDKLSFSFGLRNLQTGNNLWNETCRRLRQALNIFLNGLPYGLWLWLFWGLGLDLGLSLVNTFLTVKRADFFGKIHVTDSDIYLCFSNVFVNIPRPINRWIWNQ